MNSGMLNEHDAHRGAESKGEFLGMTGNSAWFLLGSSGASIMLVIVLWGMLGLSLLVCLLLSLILCGLSVAYVFALKNNKPAHYDTDFFESVLVDAGVLPLAFGPRANRPVNPFRAGVAATDELARTPQPVVAASVRQTPSAARATVAPATDPAPPSRESASRSRRGQDEVPTVPLAAYERLQTELNTTSELLEDALAEHAEELS